MNDEVMATHWDGCWLGSQHHLCAVTRIRALEAELAEARRERDRLRAVALAMLDAMDTPPPTEAQWRQLRGILREARAALEGEP
jgi:hypothetical protein